MEYAFNIDSRDGTKHQDIDVLAMLNTEETNDQKIDDNILLTAAAMPAPSRQNKIVTDTSVTTVSETKDPNLPKLNKFLIAQGTNASLDKIPPTVEIPRRCSILTRKDSQRDYHPQMAPT